MDDAITAVAQGVLGESVAVVEQVELGLVHETYILRDEGSDYVLQRSTADGDGRETLARGLGCYRLLADAPVPVPALVTEHILEYDGRAYTVVERLPGRPGERDITPARTRAAGRQLADIHDAVAFDRAGFPRFDDTNDDTTSGDDGSGDRGGGAATPRIEPFPEGSLGRWCARKLRDNVEYLRTDGLERGAAAVERICRDDIGPDPDETVFCHSDFSPDNLLFDGDEVVGVLDFDHALAGDPTRDAVKAANGFWMHDPTAEWDAREQFYRGYREASKLPTGFERREPRVRVEALAVTVGGMARMGELSAFEREFYEERLLDAVERVSE